MKIDRNVNYVKGHNFWPLFFNCFCKGMISYYCYLNKNWFIILLYYWLLNVRYELFAKIQSKVFWYIFIQIINGMNYHSCVELFETVNYNNVD